jgi:putative FmdB family regulatory protein
LPLYEYRCKNCGHTFEKIQSFSAPEEKECPVCKGEVERLISAPAIQFKGAGWYVNDYAGKGAAKSAASDSTAGAEKTASSDGAKSSSDSASSAVNNSGSSSGAGTASSASKSD